MAGAATALPQDSLVSASNPAGMAFVGNRLDLGVSFFNPSKRGYEANPDFATQQVPATAGGMDFLADFPAGGFITPGEYESDKDWFLIPSFGYNREIDSRSTIGISVYGNGGMNTEYKDRPVFENFAPAPNQAVVNGFPAFETDNGLPPDQGGKIVLDTGAPVPVPASMIPGSVNGNPGGALTATTPTGVNLEQLFIEIPYTIKMGDGTQSFGIAPVFAVQSFEAKGLQPFQAASVAPTKVTNNGKNWSYGLGLHLGWYGQVHEQLSLGMSYRTKVWMTDLDDYSGLFAKDGEFDIPAMFNFGLAYKARPDVTLAFDYQHIFYNEVDALANSNDLDLSPCFGATPKPSFCLGGEAGLGFGWESMDIFKLGVRWDQSEKWKFFGGVSYNTDFLKSNRQALFNVLAPATIRWHLTVGATYVHSEKDEFNLSFAYMPKETLDGTSPDITGTQTGSIFMEQKDIEISWSHHF
jgi:long-chain fatty acid transport protein